MRLPEFRYIEPESIREASAFLIDEPGAKILAGGTDILPNMKHKVELPSAVVNIKKIPELDFIRNDNRALRIGALDVAQESLSERVCKGKAARACLCGFLCRVLSPSKYGDHRGKHLPAEQM